MTPADHTGMVEPMLHDLRAFGIQDIAGCSKSIRDCGLNASSMSEVAERTVRYFYDNLVNQAVGARQCALVRFFKTHTYGDLDRDRRAFASEILGHQSASDKLKCLVLLATAGEASEWNSPATSRKHRAIPLPSVELVNRMPMISNLVSQLGFDVSTVMTAQPELVLEPQERKYGVFYVPDALESPIIPDQQQFVVPYGIKSVIGFGSLLPLGDMFAVIMFCKVAVPRSTVELIKVLALSTKVAIAPFDGVCVFDRVNPSEMRS